MDICLERSELVESLIRRVQNNRTDKEAMDELAEIANRDHLDGCALGSVPACTCGLNEAKEFVGGR